MVRLRSRFVVTSSEIIASHNGVSQQESGPLANTVFVMIKASCMDIQAWGKNVRNVLRRALRVSEPMERERH